MIIHYTYEDVEKGDSAVIACNGSVSMTHVTNDPHKVTCKNCRYLTRRLREMKRCEHCGAFEDRWDDEYVYGPPVTVDIGEIHKMWPKLPICSISECDKHSMTGSEFCGFHHTIATFARMRDS